VRGADLASSKPERRLTAPEDCEGCSPRVKNTAIHKYANLISTSLKQPCSRSPASFADHRKAPPPPKQLSHRPNAMLRIPSIGSSHLRGGCSTPMAGARSSGAAPPRAAASRALQTAAGCRRPAALHRSRPAPGPLPRLLKQQQQRQRCSIVRATHAPPQQPQPPAEPVPKAKLAVFVSGGGSNFKAIHAACLDGRIHAEVVVSVVGTCSARW
jgi:hypothetical protein